MNATPSAQLICPMIDAGKNHVYAGLYRTGPDALLCSVRPDKLMDASLFLQELDQEEITFLGGGAIRHERLIREAGKGWSILSERSRQRLMASAVGLIGRERYRCGEVVEIMNLAPRYLRLSDAEMNGPSCTPWCSSEREMS
jgi:tRNA threonylcarbamoyladenosine biosynthesis protein TsaB